MTVDVAAQLLGPQVMAASMLKVAERPAAAPVAAAVRSRGVS